MSLFSAYRLPITPEQQEEIELLEDEGFEYVSLENCPTGCAPGFALYVDLSDSSNGDSAIGEAQQKLAEVLRQSCPDHENFYQG